MEPIPAPPPTVRLQHLLLGHGRKDSSRRRTGVYDYEAWTADDPSGVKLFVQEISTEHIVFLTPAALAHGQSLELELLLQGAGAWKGLARVQWTLESQPGYKSMASLECSPEEADRLKQFIQLQLRNARG